MRYHVYPSQVRRPVRLPAPRVQDPMSYGHDPLYDPGTVRFAQDPALPTVLDGIEHGFAVYELPDGTLVHGPITHGTWNAVSISLDGPPDGELQALWHTHPGGIAVPSSKDRSEARRVGAPYIFITQPEQDELRWYEP